MTKTSVKFQRNRHKTVGGVTHTRCPLSIHFVSKIPEKWLSSTCAKSKKNNLKVISKPHAYLQTMTKASAKFQMNQLKAVGGDAHTRYILSIHFDSKMPEKRLSSAIGKSDQNQDYIQTTCISSDHEQNTC